MPGETQAKAPPKRNPGPSHVGHVAPDVHGGTFFNTLVVRPKYRMTLRLGEIDDLFEKPVDDATGPSGTNTHTGRKARLQILGYFYRPLNHLESQACYNLVWPYYKNKLHNPPLSDTKGPTEKVSKADQELLNEIKSKIVDGGVLPEPGKFAKLRLPGGYTFSSWWNNATIEPNYEAAFALGHDRAAAEQKYFDDNAAMGKIPLVAKVEKWVKGQGWAPAAGAQVYFQLQRPDDLPAFADGTACADQVNAPPLRESMQGATLDGPATETGAGQKAYVDEHVNDYKIDPETDLTKADPQVDNVHVDKGGKRGRAGSATAGPVADVIFSTKDTKGFNSKHAGRDLPHKPFHIPVSVKPVGDKHKHCVRAGANEEGEAGVIFMPSRCGGDRYKIRAYIGPPTLDSDGTEEDAVVIDTGTMVLWRTIRLSRYLRKDITAPGSFPAPILAAYTGYGIDVDTVWKGVGARKADNSEVGIGTCDWTGTGMRDTAPFPTGNNTDGTPKTKMKWEGPARQYAKAWLELSVDLCAQLPEAMTGPEQLAALNKGIARAKAGQAAFSIPWNLDEFFFHDANSPFLINVRDWDEYNNRPNVTAPQKLLATHGGKDYRDCMYEILGYFMIIGMLEHFSSNGLLPGLTLVQSPFGCMWDMVAALNSPAHGVSFTSGVALRHRGCFVWYGLAIYDDQPGFCYNLSSNCSHEMGHCLYMAHQQLPPPDNGDNAMHDMNDVCLMSYGFCEGQFCGKSLLQLRGLDISKF